ncbi:MAG: hypothetical protein ACOX20_01005 [Limnochordia bacterium]|jgi:methyl-accepting chemotaxis protein
MGATESAGTLEDLAESARTMSEAADQVSQIVHLISATAEQTNLGSQCSHRSGRGCGPGLCG